VLGGGRFFCAGQFIHEGVVESYRDQAGFERA
jgi:hypothetical protein